MLKVTKTGAVKCVENKKEIEEMLNILVLGIFDFLKL